MSARHRTIKHLGRQVLPPIAYEALRRRWRRHGRRTGRLSLEWEAIEPGCTVAAEGWARPDVAAAYLASWSDFIAAIEGSPMLGIDYEVRRGNTVVMTEPSAQQRILVFAYVLALAGRRRGCLSVLDWGGALGHYWWLARALLPELRLDYHCKETAAVCEAGRQVSPQVTFHSDDASWRSRTYGLVFASGSLHYAPDWRGLLNDLAACAEEGVLISRVPVTARAPGFQVLQRAQAYGYATDYVGWVLNRDELLDAADSAGLRLLREFLLSERYVLEEGPEQEIEHRAFLFARDAGAQSA